MFAGQFWNTGIDIEPFTGLYNSEYNDTDSDTDCTDGSCDYYIVSVMHPSSVERKFVGNYYGVTWDFEKRSCLYSGNSQGGPIREVDSPNDSVIEGYIGDYEVSGLFDTQFKYSAFNTSACI